MAGLTAAGYKPRANSAAGAGSSSRVQPLYVEPPQDQLPYHERQQPYWARQYVFVGATMPALTKRDAGSEIEDLVPGSEWLTTDGLHRIKPEVSHAWVEVAAEEEGADGAAEGGRGRSGWGHALLAAIRNDPDYPAGRAKILVFADDKESADAVSGLLAEEALPHVLYHKGVNAYERAQALEAAVRSDSVVMVSTDAAARGIDIPGVTHVIQAQFAANAVDFLHRVGRTARAGQRGKVTSLFAASDLPLVNVLRDYVSRGVPLEGAFSRSRSFSRRLKRTGGEFVPRGLTRTEFLAEAAGATPAGGGSAAAGADAAELKPAA